MTLPRITQYLETRDGGDDATCPHCGARGRWIHSFRVESGATVTAMSGCIRLFPTSPVATEHARLAKKLRDGGRLNRWDGSAMVAIESFYAGAITEDAAMFAITHAKHAANMRRTAKYGSRR